MIERDRAGNACGFVKIETEGHKGSFGDDRFFVLDLPENKLKIYYDKPENLPKTSQGPCQEIGIELISKVSEAVKMKPKAGPCFCITNLGDQMNVQAKSKEDMAEWIKLINDACKIRVSLDRSKELAPARSVNEVAGGVVVHTHESSDSDDETADNHMPAVSLPCVISGYATKQGAVRKNWKKRYFVLDANGLSYFKCDKDKKPIRTIPAAEITNARLVKGEHHPHRQNLFELITKDRTFNIQCEEEGECQKWISHIMMQIQPDDKTKSHEHYGSLNPQPSSQEEIKPSKAVWDDNSAAGDRRSKSGLKEYKKSWSLW